MAEKLQDFLVIDGNFKVLGTIPDPWRDVPKGEQALCFECQGNGFMPGTFVRCDICNGSGKSDVLYHSDEQIAQVWADIHSKFPTARMLAMMMIVRKKSQHRKQS
jgi:hypothetical protein